MRPALLTLTVDREAFGDARDAFLSITGGGFVRRLMRLLGVTRWVSVLEFQMATGEGWPHWHIVIDLPDGGIDLKRAWHLWRDKWMLGGLDLQRKPSTDARHAILYVTKYLTKFPEKGFPDWVLHFDRRIRWIAASKSIGPMVSDRERVEADCDHDGKESVPREHRTLAARMRSCGHQMNFWREYAVPGGHRYEFFGRLPREIVEASRHGRKGINVVCEGGREYIRGHWTDFSEVGALFLQAARSSPVPCGFRWSHRRRFDPQESERRSLDCLSRNSYDDSYE